MLVQLGEALSHVFVGSSAASDQLAAPAHHQVDANYHRIAELRDVQTIQIESQLGIHLLQDV